MKDINSEFIERYQMLLQNNPRSRVFAPLAEAYRKMGMLQQAADVCRQGVRLHPDFASGRVAFAKVLVDMGRWEEALEHLEQAVTLSTDNILAYRLMGQCHLKLRQPKAGLKAYKMVLFFNPQDPEAARQVKRLESLTADEYEEKLFQNAPQLMPMGGEQQNIVQMTLSLADAYMVRNQLEQARLLLEQTAQQERHPEILRRLNMLEALKNPKPEIDEPDEDLHSVKISPQDRKRARVKYHLLVQLLRRVNTEFPVDHES